MIIVETIINTVDKHIIDPGFSYFVYFWKYISKNLTIFIDFLIYSFILFYLDDYEIINKTGNEWEINILIKIKMKNVAFI